MMAMPTAAQYIAPPRFLLSGNPGADGGGRYVATETQPAASNYESLFGPAGRDIRVDTERNRRKQRLHLPDVPDAAKEFIAERIDGIVENVTNSLFTTLILPYLHHANVDGKIKWNSQSFDQALASRVPYESGVRVMTQTTQRYAGYMVRLGIGMALEVNFMQSERGRQNFRLQLEQMINAIQNTNDYDVMMALLQARSYQRTMDEQYYSSGKTQAQRLRDYVQFFGLMQKHGSGLECGVVEAQQTFKRWQAKPPTFLLCSEKLTTQLTMAPERTQYFTNGEDGVKRLKAGPALPEFRGLKIIHTKQFSIETGEPPRDMLDRRVRVAEYSRIPWHPDNPTRIFEFYDESCDSWFSLTWQDLLRAARLPGDLDESAAPAAAGYTGEYPQRDGWTAFWTNATQTDARLTDARLVVNSAEPFSHCVYVPVAARNVLAAAFHFKFEHNMHSTPNCAFGALDPAHPAGAWLRFFLSRPLTGDMCSAFLRAVPAGPAVPADSIAYACRQGMDDVAAADHCPRCVNAKPANEADRNNAACALAVAYGALMSTGTDRRRALADALPRACMEELKAVYNALVEGRGTAFQAAPGTSVELVVNTETAPALRAEAEAMPVPPGTGAGLAVNAQPDRADSFLIFLFAMMLRLFSGITGAEQNLRTDGRELADDPTRNARLTLAQYISRLDKFWWVGTALPDAASNTPRPQEIVILRPNIEHSMLGAIVGRGGTEDLGATFWGQTHLECKSDAVHSLWGLSYKYNARAIVYNEKHLIRLFDICYGSYSGGKDCTMIEWGGDGPARWREATNNTREPYEGPSLAVMSFPVAENDPEWVCNWPSPIAFHSGAGNVLPCYPENSVHATDRDYFTLHSAAYRERYLQYQRIMPNFTELHLCNKHAGELAQDNVTSIQSALAFQGSMRILDKSGTRLSEVHGCGHHGPDYIGAASRRNGKGMDTTGRGSAVGVFAAT